MRFFEQKSVTDALYTVNERKLAGSTEFQNIVLNFTAGKVASFAEAAA